MEWKDESGATFGLKESMERQVELARIEILGRHLPALLDALTSADGLQQRVHVADTLGEEWDAELRAEVADLLDSLVAIGVRLEVAEPAKGSKEPRRLETYVRRLETYVRKGGETAPVMVHALLYGKTLCGFGSSKNFPGEWPPGHRWVYHDEPDKITCEACAARALELIE